MWWFKIVAILIVSNGVSTLIIPEEIASLLGLIFNYLPPIRKGSDNRYGIGFRLGNHADFQTVIEFGPQVRTQPLRAVKDDDFSAYNKRTTNNNNLNRRSQLNLKNNLKNLRNTQKLTTTRKSNKARSRQNELLRLQQILYRKNNVIEPKKNDEHHRHSTEEDQPLKISLVHPLTTVAKTTT